MVVFPDIPYRCYCDWLVWEWRWFQSAFLLVFSGDNGERLLDLRCGSKRRVALHTSRAWWQLQGFGKYLNRPLWSSWASVTEKLISLWRSLGTSYSRDVKRIPGIRSNEEYLTFSRITLMVENGDRYWRISKNKLVERAGFSGWAKLGL